MSDLEPIPVTRHVAWPSLLQEAQKRGENWFPDFSGENFIKVNRVGSFLPAVTQLRQEADTAVTVKMARDLEGKPLIGCWDVMVNDQPYGGFLGSESTMHAMSSWVAKSATHIMFEYGIPWDQCRDFVGLTSSADRNHLQLRQVELLRLLTSDRHMARLFYGSVVTAAQELATELEKQGHDNFEIFMAGGAALLLNPNDEAFPRQVDSKPRFSNRISRPKAEIGSSGLAVPLVDTDLVIVGINDPAKLNLPKLLGQTYGRIFSPLGFKPDDVMRNFPDLIGLDVCVCPAFDYSSVTPENFQNLKEESPATFIRFPDIRKPTSVRLKSGAFVEMIPLYWSPKAKQQQQTYQDALRSLSSSMDLDVALANCAASSTARKVLYADPVVHEALEARWSEARNGKTLEQELQNLNGIKVL